MKKLLLSCCLAFGLAACGGGGESTQLANSVQVAATALKAAGVAAPDNLVAQAVSVVNTTTAGDQVFRSIGALADGGYTVAWVSDTTLFIQRFDKAGNKVGGEIVIPLFVAGSCGPSCDASTTALAITQGGSAVLSDGSVVVAYSVTRAFAPDSASSKFAVYIQRFDANGVQVLPETEVVARVEVAHYRSSSFDQLKVVPLADGGFAVGWAVVQPSSVGFFGYSISTRRYDSQAQPIGGPVMVGYFTALAGGEAYRLAEDSQGGFTVSLIQRTTVSPFPTLTSIFHFDANGTGTRIVDPTAQSVLLLPLEGGGFVLFTSDSSGSVRQMLDSAANPVGDPLPVAMPFDARVLVDGAFVVFWNTAGTITAQRYDSSGAALGDVLTIATSGALPALAALSDGGFALAWSARTAAGDFDVFRQAFLEQPGSDRAALRVKRKACLESARGMAGQERKAFMDACLSAV